MSTLIEGIRIAVTSILINRTRAGLTMLGIIIGVGAVISLISLGRGVERFVVAEFNELGANMLIVSPKQPDSDARTRVEPLSTGDVDALLQPGTAPSVRQIAPQYNIITFVNNGGESMRTNVRGVTANYSDVRNWLVGSGRFITEQEIEDEARVAVIGPDVIEEIWEDTNFDPVGSTIRIQEQIFTVVGVMNPRDEPITTDNDAILIPMSTAQRRLSQAQVRGGYEVHTMYVQAWSREDTYTAKDQIINYFWEAHDIRNLDEEDFDVINFAEQLEIAEVITGLLTVFLGIIAGVSLLVGGIGIMNIMLVTVTERTKEIGLRKAMGAQPRDILAQFLFESIILSLLGGVVGILLGWIVAEVGTAQVESLTLSVDPDAIILATGVSTFVGVFFGLFPSWKASQLNPIDALNFE